MAGEIKRMLDSLVEQRAQGNPTLVATTISKLILKGVNPNRFDNSSPDDPALLAKIKTIATEFGVNL